MMKWRVLVERAVEVEAETASQALEAARKVPREQWAVNGTSAYRVFVEDELRRMQGKFARLADRLEDSGDEAGAAAVRRGLAGLPDAEEEE